MSNKIEPNALAEVRAQRVATVLRYQGFDAAEKELEKIASTEGDEAIMALAPHLSSADVSTITAEGDIVKPTLLHAALAPEQFRKVFRRVGITWSAAGQEECPHDTLQAFQGELNQFFCAFLLLNDGERRVKLMEVILDEPHGLDALVFSVVNEIDFADFIASDGKTADVGDWREVIGILRFHFPEMWEKFKMGTPSHDGSDVSISQFVANIHVIAAEIYAVAVAESGIAQTEVKGEDDLFTPLK